jgi:hypothetical protein
MPTSLCQLSENHNSRPFTVRLLLRANTEFTGWRRQPFRLNLIVAGGCMAEIYTMMLVTTVLGGAGLLSYVMYLTGAFRKSHARRQRINL